MIDFEVKNNLQKFDIEIISPTGANFDSELNRHIGDFDVLIPLVETAKPLVGFIKNNSSKEVVGISLQWSLFKPDGAIVYSADTGVSSPGVLMGMKPRDPWMVGKTSLINSNELRFFSYFGNSLEGYIENAHKRIKYQRIKYNPLAEHIRENISYIEYRKDTEKQRLGISKYIVSVDGIFFNDGIFIGENQNLYFESTGGSIQSRRDFLRKLRKAKSTGKNDSEVLEYVIADISKIIESIPEYKPISPRMRPGSSRFANGEEAFNQGYKSSLKHLKDEVIRRKTKFSDTVIINDFLEVEDKDFIEIHRES
ncbi:MAG: hypothetical protein ACR2N3_18355 [Pyrinomonadaceae bacterium]